MISTTKAVRWKICIVALIFLYFLENTSILGDSFFLIYIVMPVLWFLLAYLILVFPRVKVQGKLRLRNFLSLLAITSGIFYIAMMVAGGFLGGFGKSPYSFSPSGIIINIFYVGSMLLGMELSRAYLINTLTLKRRPLLTIGIISLFYTFINLPFYRILSLGTNPFEIIKYAGNIILPLFSENIFTSYLSYLGGPAPALIYQGMLKGFRWFCPVLPNPGWIIKTLSGALVPFISLIIVQQLYLVETRKIRNTGRNKESVAGWVLTGIFSILIIWFAVGLFPIYPKVIVTGSMMPVIDPGDVVIMQKIDGDNIKVGDVVQFRHAEMDVIHRVIEVAGEKPVMYKTKGDNNPGPDSDLIRLQQIKGRLVGVIPKIGWPTLILRGSGGVSTDNVEI